MCFSRASRGRACVNILTFLESRRNVSQGKGKDLRMVKTAKQPEPVPSGSMYIGICNMRAQSVALRWQKTIVLATVNVTLMGVWVQYVSSATWTTSVGLCVVAFAFSGLNARYAHGLAERSSQWIEYYTEKLRMIEDVHGTESGVRIFSDPEYISRMEMEHKVRGIRFRKGMQGIVSGIAATWLVLGIASALVVAYNLGKAST